MALPIRFPDASRLISREPSIDIRGSSVYCFCQRRGGGAEVLEVRVLGPIEIHHESRPVHFGRRQQRLIVGILALEANQEISCERLIDLLWGEDPPRQARSVVQTRLSEARATLSQHDLGEHTRLVSSGDSYVLQIPDGQVDAQRFRRAAADHRNLRSDELARVALRDALGLWRGPVLGTRAIDDSLGDLCQSLEAARLTAWEDLFEVELRLGRHFEIVDELVELAARNRSRERLVEHMMLALHRTGRSAEALQAYDRWRRWLRPNPVSASWGAGDVVVRV